MSAVEPDWDLFDAVDPFVTDAPQTPSTIARKAKVSTNDAHRALRWLAANHYAVAVGNGAWTKYRRRQAGEALITTTKETT